jgi:hypothetical protein
MSLAVVDDVRTFRPAASRLSANVASRREEHFSVLIDAARAKVEKARTQECLRPRGQLSQSTSVCEYELFESHEWLTDDLGARAIGSSEKTFLLIDSDRFEVGLFCLLAFHAQQLEELGHRGLFKKDGFVERL